MTEQKLSRRSMLARLAAVVGACALGRHVVSAAGAPQPRWTVLHFPVTHGGGNPNDVASTWWVIDKIYIHTK